jgi:hypothetical protein
MRKHIRDIIAENHEKKSKKHNARNGPSKSKMHNS